MINIVCDVCRNKLPIMGDKQNKKSTTIRVGLCGYCETMAMKLVKIYTEGKGMGGIKNTNLEITIEKTRDGRYAARYFNKFEPTLSGLSQFGKTPLDAHLNLQVLIKRVRDEQLKTNISIIVPTAQ